jgi:hypothetical protein
MCTRFADLYIVVLTVEYIASLIRLKWFVTDSLTITHHQRVIIADYGFRIDSGIE